MPESHKRSATWIEILCTIAIVAVAAALEFQFNLFSLIGQWLSSQIPFLQGQSVVLFAACWIGLFVYSMQRRRELSSAHRARDEIEQDLELSKVTDAITGLPNGFGLQCYLQQQVDPVDFRALTLLAVDLTNLESINMVHGGDVATEVVQDFSRFLLGASPRIQFCARGNGTSFYIIIKQGTRQQQQELIAQIVEATKQFARNGTSVRGLHLSLYVCFGIVCLEAGAQRSQRWNGEGIIRRVDYAVRTAARAGNESVREFDEQMELTRRRRTIIEASLRDAIESRTILPYFQPFIDLKTNRITGFEILSRWTHPSEGRISPEVFIPIAEEMGQLRKLTLTILDQVCLAAADWPSDLKLALNISPTDLKNQSMIVELLATLKRHQFDPARIELEITESAFIEEIDTVNSIVGWLKSEGLTISIDDFGTGYSSLQHLKSLPFDKIKIDQSFIRDMETNQESKKIVQAIIALANSLGVPTTAEGVELEPNLSILSQLGCSYGQGFLIARPLKAEDVPAFLAEFRRQSQFAATA